MTMQWVQTGPSAILITFAEKPSEKSFQICCALITQLELRAFPSIKEVTPAFISILVELDLRGGQHLKAVAAEILKFCEKAAKTKIKPSPIHEIPVVYRGPDTERVCDLKKLTLKQLITLHSKPIYLVHFLGFSPGFGYLGGLSPKLHTPRLASPRSRVEAGSVAIGGEHTGIYSVETPGGWNIIGRTPFQLFRPSPPPGAEQSAFLLHQGDRVKFVPTGS